MGANDKLAATFHPHEPPTTTGTMIDAITYPLDDDTISVTERARPIINAMLAEAKAEALREAAQDLWSEPYENFEHHPHQINNLHEASLVNGGIESASEWLRARADRIEKP